MPCYYNQEAAAEAARQRAIKRLEQQLKDKSASLAKFGGRATIRGWNGDRSGFCDECAIDKLLHSQDFRIRQMAAEQLGSQEMVRDGHSH